MYIATLLLSLCAIRSVTAEATFSKGTRNCAIVSDKTIKCECQGSGSDWNSCSKTLGDFLLNSYGKLAYWPMGDASRSCTGYSLDIPVLGAYCGAKNVAIINLDEICSVENGKIECNGGEGSSEPTTTLTGGSASATGGSASATGGSASATGGDAAKSTTSSSSLSGPSSAASSSPTDTSVTDQSAVASQTSASTAETTTGTSVSADATDACGVQRRMRIMGQ